MIVKIFVSLEYLNTCKTTMNHHRSIRSEIVITLYHLYYSIQWIFN